MRYHVVFIAVAIATLAPGFLFATSSAEELVEVLQDAVEKAQVGDYYESIRIINSVSRSPTDPTKALEQASKMQEDFRDVDQLGETDGVEQVSLRYVGDSFLRLRIVDKRAKGVILWTFIGYRFKGEWHCVSRGYHANSNLAKIMRESLDPADAKE